MVNGKKAKIAYDKNYCEKCWPKKPQRYLMSYAANDTATCLPSCDPGWTTNGNKPDLNCVKCNVMCDSCEDDGDVGDKDRCKTCSKDYPFAYTAQAMCKKTCDFFEDKTKKDPVTK